MDTSTKNAVLGRTFSLLFLLALLVSGCKSNKAFIEENRSEVEKRIAEIERAFDKVQETPALTKTTLDYSGPKIHFTSRFEPVEGARVIGIRDWDDRPGDPELSKCAQARWHSIRKAQKELPRKHFRHFMGIFLGAGYVLVVKEDRRVEPVAGEVLPSFNPLFRNFHFTPGYWFGEAHLVRLKDGVSFGGFRFFATNSESPSLSSEDRNKDLAEDLEREILKRASERLFGLIGELDFPNVEGLTADQAKLIGVWYHPDDAGKETQRRVRITRRKIYFEVVRDHRPLSHLIYPINITGEYHLDPGARNQIEFTDEENSVWKGTWSVRGDELSIDFKRPENSESATILYEEILLPMTMDETYSRHFKI